MNMDSYELAETLVGQTILNNQDNLGHLMKHMKRVLNPLPALPFSKESHVASFLACKASCRLLAWLNPALKMKRPNT